MKRLQYRADLESLEALESLRLSPLPLGLVESSSTHGFYRDIYLDTQDCALRLRGILVRFRFTHDDRRLLTLLTQNDAEDFSDDRFDAEIAEVDYALALSGDTVPARRIRALTDPALLEPWLQLETERWERVGRPRWPWGRDQIRFIYRKNTVRSGGLARDFYQAAIRKLSDRGPSLEQVAKMVEQHPGCRLATMPTHLRAAAVLNDLEGEVLARALGSGRAVALIVQEDDQIAFLTDQHGAHRLPVARGSGEDAVRFLLKRTLGSSVADLALLGLAPGSSIRPALEVWSAHRVRTDMVGSQPIVWMTVAEVLGRVGDPDLRDPETLAALTVLARSSPIKALVSLQSAAWVEDRTGSFPVPLQEHPQSSGDPEYPPQHFNNVELSQLAFNQRVLELAEDESLPLLERLRYLAIVSANLDEFFAVRVGALRRREVDSPDSKSIDGLIPGQQLEAVAARVRAMISRQQQCLGSCLHLLAAKGFLLRRWEDLDLATASRMTGHFRANLLPDLTPRLLGHSPGHPFPVIPAQTLAFGMLLRESGEGPAHFSYLLLPQRLSRILPTGNPGEFILLEDLVKPHLTMLYPSRTVEQAWLFRVTRSADLDVEEEEAGDLRQALAEELDRRALNPVVRIEAEEKIPRRLRELLIRELRFEQGDSPSAISENDFFEISGILDLTMLRTLAAAAVPGLAQGDDVVEFPPTPYRDPIPETQTVFEWMRAQDRLVYHPYESFSATVQRFFVEASEDPAVTSIKMALYRAGDASPVVDALCAASRAGKDVAVFVELKARFDEQRNIAAVSKMEGAGVQVVYGIVGLKNHAKIAMVVRHEDSRVVRYSHIGTGNYNAATSRFYTDLGLFTVDDAVAGDLTSLFNQLTGSSGSPRGPFQRLLVAPSTMLDGILTRIVREEGHARAGLPAGIRAQLNGLEDPEIIEALYRASGAGVKIELLVRGLCTLRPGVFGLSDRITVKSVLGRFLEHSRIYHFRNGPDGRDEYLIGSADWRQRNLRRRVEVLVPITADQLKARLDNILTRALAEPSAWELVDGKGYLRTEPPFEVKHLHEVMIDS